MATTTAASAITGATVNRVMVAPTPGREALANRVEFVHRGYRITP